MKSSFDVNNSLYSPLSVVYVQHKETGAVGTVVNEMNEFNPPQFGVQWLGGANHSKFPHAYYWNDKNKLKVLGGKLPDELMLEYNSHKREFERLYELCNKNLLMVEVAYAVYKAYSGVLTMSGTHNELLSLLNFKPFKSWAIG